MYRRPVFSVIVCTALRINLLSKCLESLLSQTISENDYEIIVVNNVIDSEAEVQDLILRIDPNKRILYAVECEEGLSQARNHGISLAKGDILAFIDDDAIADPTWLETLHEVYVDNPDAAAVGGKIALMWESVTPEWLHPELYGYLGELDYSESVIQIQKEKRLGGGNLSFQRSWFKKCSGFSNRLGRNRSSFLSGEEVELILRFQRLEGKCYFTPHAVVHHFAPKSRLTKGFFRKRSYWGGRSSLRIDLIHFPSQIIWNVLRRIVCIPYHAFGSLWFKLTNRVAISFLWETYSVFTLGYLIELMVELVNPSGLNRQQT